LGRYLAFATHRPASALILDVTWLVLMLPAVAVLIVTGAKSLPWLAVVWGGSGALAGLLTLCKRGARLRLGLGWLRQTWRFSWRFLLSYSSTQGVALAGSTAVGGIAGARALGGINGAVLLVRPFMTFQMAAIASVVSDISHAVAGNGTVRGIGVRTSALASVVAAANAGVLLVLPDKLGEVLLGPTWAAAEPLLLATGVQIFCLGLATGMRAGLLGIRAVGTAMAIDVGSTGLILGATVVGALVNGALGAVWAVALGQAVLAIVWWTAFWTSTREPVAAADDRVDASSPTTY
jgi:O-antigen/teichoic acid export membrane protein